MDPISNLLILDIANSQKDLGCGIEDSELSFGFRMNPRVIAHLFLVHECVQGRDEFLPITHHLLVLYVGTIDELDDCI